MTDKRTSKKKKNKKNRPKVTETPVSGQQAPITVPKRTNTPLKK